MEIKKSNRSPERKKSNRSPKFGIKIAKHHIKNGDFMSLKCYLKSHHIMVFLYNFIVNLFLDHD